MDFIYQIFGTPLGWIMYLCYTVIQNYGIALIIFTFLIKLALFPLGIKQHKTSIKQAMLKPQIDELQKRYKDNREKLAQEQQKLYAEAGVSMFGGCSTMFIQLPILFGLIDVVYKPLTHILRFSTDVIEQAEKIAEGISDFAMSATTPQLSIVNAVQENPELFTELGTDFISKVEALKLTFLGIDLTQTPTFALNILILVPILAGVTTVIQTLIMTKLSPMSALGSSMPGMNVTMYATSAMFVFFTFQVPTGIGIYWIASNIFGILQQIVIYKLYNPFKLRDKYLAVVEARKKEAKEAAKAKPVVVIENGEKVEKTLNQKELEKLRLAKARELDMQKYGDGNESNSEKE